MGQNYKNIAIDKVRREDRVGDEKFIKEFLNKSPFCTIANILNDQPFLHVNIFYYSEEDHAIYFHTASEGRFRFNIENNNKVCLSIAKMGRLLPADEALEFSLEYESVAVFGEVSILTDKDKSKAVLQQLLDKYFSHLTPDVDYRSTTDYELKRTTIYQLNIAKWSGKINSVEPDFPGAIYYGENNVS